VLGKGDDTGAIDLAFEPGNPQVVYASLWQARRTPWNVYPPASGPGSGLYKSTDGGDSWTQLRGNGFPEANVGRIGIAIGDSAPARVYAIVDGNAGGLYRSTTPGRIGAAPPTTRASGNAVGTSGASPWIRATPTACTH
jgi:hypothetical protein